MKAIRRYLGALLLILSFNSVAEQQSLLLVPGQTYEHIMHRMLLVDGVEYGLDRAGNRHRLRDYYKELPITLPPPVALNSSELWLVTELRNVGEEAATWVLDTREPFRRGVRVWLENDGEQQLILQASRPPQALAERVVTERILRSSPVTLAPGASAYLWIQHEDTWSAKEALDLVPVDELLQRRSNRSLEFGLLNGFLALLVVFFLVFAAVLRFVPGFWYSVLFGTLLVSNFHYEGILFELLYPQNPEVAELMIGILAGAILVPYLVFLYSVLPVARKNRLMNLAVASLFAMVLFVSFLRGDTGGTLSQSPLFSIAFILGIAISLGFAAIGVHHRVAGAYVLAVGVVLFLLRILIGMLAELAWIDLSIYSANQIIPALQLVDGLVFAAFLVKQAIHLRQDRDRVNQRLAGVSHDLQQPLTSLRASLDEVNAVAPLASDKISASLEYLDSILDESLQDTAPVRGDERPPGSGPEPVAVQMLFDNVYRMFFAEAKEKSLSLRCVPTSAVVYTEPVALIRMLSNLVSNAIKYTDAGGVLIGLRRRGSGYAIEVWDTGPGMTPQELQRLLKPYERGQHGQGTGLGLDSVSTLAAEVNVAFRIDSQPGSGSVFRLENLVPV